MLRRTSSRSRTTSWPATSASLGDRPFVILRLVRRGGVVRVLGQDPVQTPPGLGQQVEGSGALAIVAHRGDLPDGLADLDHQRTELGDRILPVTGGRLPRS